MYLVPFHYLFFFIVSGDWFFSCLCPIWSFLSIERVLFNVSLSLVQWSQTTLVFLGVGKSFSVLVWMTALLSRVFLVADFSLLTHWMYYTSDFWPARFLLRNLQPDSWVFPCKLGTLVVLMLLTSNMMLLRFFHYWHILQI